MRTPLALIRRAQSQGLPRFAHHCDCCTLLGAHGAFDLYHHADGHRSTVIARYGNDPGAYLFGMPLAYGAHEALTQARLQAQACGLCPYELSEALQYTPADKPLDESTHLLETLLTDELGRALMALAVEPVVGMARMRAWFTRFVDELQASHPHVSLASRQGLAAQTIANALFWLQRHEMAEGIGEGVTRARRKQLG